MATPVQGLAVQTGPTPGTPVTAIDVNQAGGYVVNPVSAVDQGQAAAAQPAILYVNQVTGAGLVANGTCIALQPGQSYTIIPNTTTPVSVASPIANHLFTAVMWPTA
jgi:hypothetical protein